MRRSRVTVLGAALVTAATAGRAAAVPGEPPRAAPTITLEQAVQTALARNPTVTAAKADIARAEALVRQARSTWQPNASANVTATRLDAERALNGRVISPVTSLSANVVATVPLVVPQRWLAGRHAEDNVTASRDTAENTRRQIAVSVARAYLVLVTQHRVIEVRLRALATARAHYEFAQARFQGGVGNRVDQVRAEQEVASTEVQLQAAYSGLEQAREVLGFLVGVEGPLDSAQEPVLPSPPPAGTADTAAHRADVRAVEARARAAQNLVNDQPYEYSPSLTAQFQPFYQNPPSLTQPQFGWQAQLLLTVPIWDAGQRSGVLAERQALANQAWANLEAAQRQARSEVRVAFDSMHRAEAALDSARHAAKVAAEALDLASLAYRAGATNNLEVVDAERRAQDADTAAATAEDSLRQARLDVLVASGRFP